MVDRRRPVSHGMERDPLIGELMAKTSAPRYRAVGANGLPTETSSTDDEMLDITAGAAYNEYADLTDKSQGQSEFCHHRGF